MELAVRKGADRFVPAGAPYVLRLLRGKIRYHTAPPPMRSVELRQPEGAFARYPVLAPLAPPVRAETPALSA